MKLLRMLFFLAFIASCGHQDKNHRLATTYFKMSYVELSEDPDDLLACRRALGYLDQALVYDQRAEFYALKATLLFKLKNFNDSEAVFKKALSMADNDSFKADITNNYACLFAQKGFIEKAKSMWHELSKNSVYQTPEVAFFNLGKMAIQENHYAHAKDFFQQAVELSPSYIDAHVYLSKVAQRLGLQALAQQEDAIVRNLI